MRLHVDVLGLLHVLWGVFGVLIGASLGVLAVGTGAALVDIGSMGRAERGAVWVLVTCASMLAALGVTAIAVGRSLRRRRATGRVAALVLAVPNLVIVPFGTALGVYTFWVLLNDDARREFGRPPHGTSARHATSLEGA
jgi:hypothetical protein